MDRKRRAGSRFHLQQVTDGPTNCPPGNNGRWFHFIQTSTLRNDRAPCPNAAKRGRAKRSTCRRSPPGRTPFEIEPSREKRDSARDNWPTSERSFRRPCPRNVLFQRPFGVIFPVFQQQVALKARFPPHRRRHSSFKTLKPTATPLLPKIVLSRLALVI